MIISYQPPCSHTIRKGPAVFATIEMPGYWLAEGRLYGTLVIAEGETREEANRNWTEAAAHSFRRLGQDYRRFLQRQTQ
jgi:hypothetical protein